MVFRGKPSKSCLRCRKRKLRCDLKPDGCSACIRANAMCSGYRDTEQLRIKDESQVVQYKVHGSDSEGSQPLIALAGSRLQPPPWSLCLSMKTQARDAFFHHYVTGAFKTWEFLAPYYNPVDGPTHLSLSIDAVSLAYLSHQVCSDAALTIAREKYVYALQATNKALRSSNLGSDRPMFEATLLSSLMLDLFEKITYNDSHPIGWTDHVRGALALVKLKGMQNFQIDSSIRVLVRVSTNLIISCVASGLPIPDYVQKLRDYAGDQLGATDPKWQLAALMIEYSNFRYEVQCEHLSLEKCIRKCIELDEGVRTLGLNKPLKWDSETIVVPTKPNRVFGDHFDIYSDKKVTQTWNVARLVRILLNESIVEYCMKLEKERDDIESLALIMAANSNIAILVDEICASVPQYTDCSDIAQGRLVATQSSAEMESRSDLQDSNHLHSPLHKAECYSLIFPLFVAGQTKITPEAQRSWILGELHHLGSHFGIRNAERVCQILERREYTNPWGIYAMLGSYAFAA